MKIWLRPKLLKYFLFFSVVILFLLATNSFFEREKALADLSQNVINFSEITEKAIVGSVEKIDLVMTKMAEEVRENRTSFKNYSWDRLSRNLQYIGIAKLDLALTDAEGNVLLTTAYKEKKKVSIADRDYFQSLRRSGSEMVISKPLLSRTRNIWIILFARRLEDAAGNFIGIVYANLDAKYFAGFAESLHLLPSDLLTLASGKELRFVFRHPAHEQFVGQLFRYSPFTAEVVAKRKKSAIAMLPSANDGRVRMMQATWIDRYPILLIVGKEAEAALATWRTHTIVTFSLALLFILLSYGLLLAYEKENEQSQTHIKVAAEASKLAALGEMAGGIAHEINNPVAIIQTVTE